MSRFRCIGPECEASCCSSGWTINIDEPHYHELDRAMRGSPQDRARFLRAVRLEADAQRTAPRYALMVLDERGRCRLLDGDGGCSVHRRFGESVLPNTCAIYPRKISVAHQHIELAGSLSCPEVARQLFREADATTIDPLDPSTLRNRATQKVPYDSPDVYDQHLDDVRATIVGLLENERYPLASRLFFVGWFAEQTRDAFHRGAGLEGIDALADAIETASDETTLASWHHAFTSLQVTTPLAGRVIAGALKDRVEEALAYEPFRELVRGCYASLGAHVVDGALTLDSAATYAAYVAARDARDGPAIDAMLTRYAIDYWLKDYYTGSHDLAIHANKLVLRIALLRFLLFTHPQYDALDPAKTLVEVTYKLSRAVEHDHDFADNLDTLLARLDITSLAHAMFLMKV
jgi:lysine-N-methylase